ncbi:MAG: RNA-guided pseudouridylation complex pseudouridine synthase subunit Cbf5 [Candidatus Bathyarchaeota archaeon]|nr:RNA-guided pseudouridylation complex pseudouridine synthase subunit Cbf5 [Candidatus Bathyarchaeota archaeon]
MPKTRPPWETKRELHVKNEDTTDPKYGSTPQQRPPEQYIRYGVINLDKTAGPTSHEVAAWTKKILKLQNIGHGGTLDPKVTGVLPITLEDATKVVQALLYSGKEYICVMKLHGDVQESRVRKVLSEFEDEIYQRPPLRSSVKRQIRTRRIYYNEFIEMEGRNVLFRVGCEGGTYIRKLCYDIGEILGVGGHMQELRRSRSGPFSEENEGFVTLHDVAYWFGEWQENKDPQALHRIIQPMETALELIPKIVVRDSAVDALCHGANLTAPGVLSVESGVAKDSIVAVLTLKGEAVALAKAAMNTFEILSAKRGTVATLERVLMDRGTYPKTWKTDSANKHDRQPKKN